jgi:hypothetical protein
MCKTIHTANQILPQYVGSSVIRQSRFITLVSRFYDPCGVDGCVEEEGSLSVLHASTQF